eukprot:1157780-Pelagomonas_calceolata.AAC.3
MRSTRESVNSSNSTLRPPKSGAQTTCRTKHSTNELQGTRLNCGLKCNSTKLSQTAHSIQGYFFQDTFHFRNTWWATP